MSSVLPCLIPSAEALAAGAGWVIRCWMPIWSSWPVRCRPNSVLAARFDLKVFFAVVAKPVAAVTATDVLGFITAQRTGARSPARAGVRGRCRR